jgi:hypothetical protein
MLGRLARFHLLNGLVSMAGNLLMMRSLVGARDLDPVAANIVAIVVCSILNFAASEIYVFRRAAIAVIAALIVSAPATAGERAPVGAAAVPSADLQPRTLQAWSAYERSVDGRHDAHGPASSPFFAQDAFGTAGWRPTAIRGGVAMTEIDRPRPGGPEASVPDGKIHHWAGAVFVPDTSVAAVLEKLSRLAGNEARYHEDVIASKLLAREGDRYRIFMKLRRTKVITVTYHTEHAVEYRRLSPTRATARSVSTRIAELEEAGTRNEREKPVGSDSGYLWRLNAYWRYEAVDDGVLIECESVSLSRAVPYLLRPFISGVVEGLARDSLERTLTELRAYLTMGGNGRG